MPLFALTVFLSAFLLFQVQPMLGKMILPHFGGAAGVWNVCMVFFQTALLGGYAYAHGLRRHARSKAQAWIHSSILLLACLSLPLSLRLVEPLSRPETSPLLGVLGVLAMSIGLPYLALSATSTLVQAWFAQSHPGRSPYRLYALSNVGSLLALVGYILIIEPRLTISRQCQTWSGAFVLFAVLCAICAWRASHNQASTQIHACPSAADPAVRPPWSRRLLWVALAACGSAMLLATTNHLTQDVASTPLLWVVPLIIYLLSFIICFEHERWYRRWLFMPALAASTAWLIWAQYQNGLGLGVQTAGLLVFLASVCMVCHGELATRKPPPSGLSEYYLLIAAGGAVGGMMIAFGAPLLLPDLWEMPIGAILTLALAARLAFSEPAQPDLKLSGSFAGRITVGMTTLMAATMLFSLVVNRDKYVTTHRNFYGVLRLREENNGAQCLRKLIHGNTVHGLQFMDTADHPIPCSYYAPWSGAGIALRCFPNPDGSTTSPPMRVGVIGLGVGTLATYAKPQDEWTFFEIDPAVEPMARQHFTYLQHAAAPCQFVLGDGRMTLARELAAGQPRRFDVLVVDAFSSDAIPTHLLTREAGDIYWKHLQDDGILALHLTNRHLDLIPIAFGMAQQAGKQARYIVDLPARTTREVEISIWVLITNNQAFLNSPDILSSATPGADCPAPMQWTDDFTPLWPIFHRTVIHSPFADVPLQGHPLLDESGVLTMTQRIFLEGELRRICTESGQRILVTAGLTDQLPAGTSPQQAALQAAKTTFGNLKADQTGILLLACPHRRSYGLAVISTSATPGGPVDLTCRQADQAMKNAMHTGNHFQALHDAIQALKQLKP